MVYLGRPCGSHFLILLLRLLKFLKVKLKNGFRRVAFVDFAKHSETSGFYLINLLIFDGNPSVTFF